MRFPRSPAASVLLIIVLLGCITGAGLSTTWLGAGILWTLSLLVGALLLIALLSDPD
jgi:hypothetical protein